MKTLTVKQKQVIDKNDITVEKVEQGNVTTYCFLIAGCYNQQKTKDSEYEAYIAGIEHVLSKKSNGN